MTDEDSRVSMPLGTWHGDADLKGFYLVGQLLSHRGFHFDLLWTTLLREFDPIRGMETKLIEGDRILFRFEHQLDRQRVLDTWAFEKSILVLKQVDDTDSPLQIDLDWCDFHIRVHNLPLGKMTRDIAKFIGNQLGCFIDVDLDLTGDYLGLIALD
ncbi:hypothetical protein Salat_0830000 [Sesamum alatum]|uniref:DUF4283 domain-containing protein n=1 Tax=Sesamum alatum TaxID=300844 RepID=A0AAE2CQQ3_9LAMI|nr:hypothetical protein Salat_0830000 [Sesamum alatum]